MIGRRRPPPTGTGITPDTGFDLVALQDGRCVGVATKFHGEYGERENARVAEEWRRCGFAVVTVPTRQIAPYLESLRGRQPVGAPEG